MSVQYYPLKVIKKVRETENSFSFYFQPEKEAEKFYYQPAQFLTFQFEIEGKAYVRSYSLASSSLLGETMKTTIVRVSNGVVSNYMIDEIEEGSVILSQPPLGEFFSLPSNLKPKEYVLFGAGIGITPLFSILKTVLHISPRDTVHLLYSSRNEELIIYKKELEDLHKQYGERLRLQHILSQREGRLDPLKMTKLLGEPLLKNALFYLCGPKDYMNMIQDFLKDKGVEKTNIHTEDFKVVPILGPKPNENSVFFTADTFKEGEPENLKASFDGETVTIPLNRRTSLLEQLLDQGYSPPFSCTAGSCMTCMARLKEGKVFQLDEGILSEENIKALEILTCQAYPLSEKVVLDYDDI